MNSFRYRRSEKVAVSLLFLVLSVLCGCASAPHPDRYRLQGIQQQLVVRYGVVIAVRPVEVEAPGTGVGSTIGASAAATAASGLSPPARRDRQLDRSRCARTVDRTGSRAAARPRQGSRNPLPGRKHERGIRARAGRIGQGTDPSRGSDSGRDRPGIGARHAHRPSNDALGG